MLLLPAPIVGWTGARKGHIDCKWWIQKYAYHDMKKRKKFTILVEQSSLQEVARITHRFGEKGAPQDVVEIDSLI